MMRRHKTQRGFSLLELMAAVSVTGILLAVGVPSFQSTLLKARATSLADSLIAAVYFVRSEAISRNTRISLCASADGSTCEVGASSWNSGWIAIDTADTVIKIWNINATNSQVELLNLGTPIVNVSQHRLVYNALGDATMQDTAGAAVSATIGFTTKVVGCAGTDQQRRLAINASGRLVVSREDCT